VGAFVLTPDLPVAVGLPQPGEAQRALRSVRSLAGGRIANYPVIFF